MRQRLTDAENVATDKLRRISHSTIPSGLIQETIVGNPVMNCNMQSPVFGKKHCDVPAVLALDTSIAGTPKNTCLSIGATPAHSEDDFSVWFLPQQPGHAHYRPL